MNQKLRFKRKIKDIKQHNEEMEIERDAAFEECKKLNQLIEEIKRAKEEEQPVAPIDVMSNEQVQNYIQNLK